MVCNVLKIVDHKAQLVADRYARGRVTGVISLKAAKESRNSDHREPQLYALL